MDIVDSIPAWLAASPPAAEEASASASSATSPLDHSATSPSHPSPAFISSPPDSPFATPHSPLYPDCERLADTLLADIAMGTQCLAAIAASHHIPYPRFTLWLLQSSTKERLAVLSVAIASAARLTATAALPDIVRGLKSTVDQLQHPSHPTLAPPGPDALRAQSLILRRHHAIIAAASLIYRISRFTVPCHRDRPRATDDLGASSRARSARDNSPPPRRNLARLPRLDLSAIDFADLDLRPARDSVAASASLPSTSPKGEVSPKATVGAPAFPTDSSRPSSSTSDIPLLTSDIVSDESPMPTEEALQTIIEDFDLDEDEAAELRKDPPTWIRANLLEQNGLVEVKPRAKRRSRADDG